MPRPGGRLGALLVALGLGLAPLGLSAPAQAADDPVVETVLSVPGTPEPDGTPVTLDATLLTTDPSVPRPAAVLAHGLGGTKADSLPTARTLARDGYAVLVYTARGFGASGGLVHLDDPAYEGRDAVAMVDAAARRPEVEKVGPDGAADPVIGFAGASYGGAVALEVAVLDRRVDAIVPAFTWADLTSALVPQSRVEGPAASLADVTPAGGTGVLKAAWAALLFTGTAAGGSDGSGEQPTPSVCGRFAADVCRAYVQSARTGTPGADLLALARRSSPDLSRIEAPTLMIQGEDDTLFGLDQADRVLRGLPATTPAATAWVPGGHDASVSVDDQLDRVTAWFDRYLKRDPAAPVVPALSVTVARTSLVGDAGGDSPTPPRVLESAGYPGRGSGGPGTRTVALAGDEQTVVNPAGARPGALTNLPGAGAAGAAAAAAGYPLAVLPGQAATFTSAPVERPDDLVGSGRARLRVTSSTSEAVLYASVWDLGPDDPQTGRPTSAVLPGRAVAPVRLTGLTPGEPTTVEVALPAVSHQVPVSHRLQLVLATTDSAYAGPVAPATYSVALVDGGLVLPDLTGLTATGGSRLDVPVPLVLAVAAVLVAALVGLVLLRRARRAFTAGPERPDLADVPLVVEGLEKTYADGLKAVDGVTFRAERGQVVGLLGPNGAGKTTTLRMVVGLIRPDAGGVWVEGRPVHGGADVLDAVGALIEGPGFLPHLSGRANLEAYWQATGRPAQEAHLEEVLAIADLGTSVERRVRGYSQGMRQRLGIAQAMLGLPALLLLDEPTNGLDPPQITAMRRVLADYAAAGRTVLVSSHLLAEVEQSCDHVVVMARGRVLLSEATATLTGDGRRRLEEAFLDLVGTGPAGGGV